MVYVIQENPRINILPAQKFGKLNFLFNATYQIQFSSGQVSRLCKTKLSKFSDEDYLLLIGHPILIGLATMWAAEWNKGKVKVLVWDRQQHQYYVNHINKYEKGEELHE